MEGTAIAFIILFLAFETTTAFVGWRSTSLGSERIHVQETRRSINLIVRAEPEDFSAGRIGKALPLRGFTAPEPKTDTVESASPGPLSSPKRLPRPPGSSPTRQPETSDGKAQTALEPPLPRPPPEPETSFSWPRRLSAPEPTPSESAPKPESAAPEPTPQPEEPKKSLFSRFGGAPEPVPEAESAAPEPSPEPKISEPVPKVESAAPGLTTEAEPAAPVPTSEPEPVAPETTPVQVEPKPTPFPEPTTPEPTLEPEPAVPEPIAEPEPAVPERIPKPEPVPSPEPKPGPAEPEPSPEPLQDPLPSSPASKPVVPEPAIKPEPATPSLTPELVEPPQGPVITVPDFKSLSNFKLDSESLQAAPLFVLPVAFLATGRSILSNREEKKREIDATIQDATERKNQEVVNSNATIFSLVTAAGIGLIVIFFMYFAPQASPVAPSPSPPVIIQAPAPPAPAPTPAPAPVVVDEREETTSVFDKLMKKIQE